MKDMDNKIIFLSVALLFGILVAVQFKTTTEINRTKSTAVMGIEELKKQLSAEIDTGKALKAEIEKNEKSIEANMKSMADKKNDEIFKQELAYLDLLKLKAGLVNVKGPGITIKLDDAAIRKADNPNVLLIHDNDIIRVLNELKAAGAQAIAINGERIISTSEQVCAGPTIRINRNRYAVPYIITAIGNSDRMYDTINKSEPIALMINDKIKVEVSKNKELLIPKYSNNDLDNLISGLEVLEK